jgi:Mn-containing catalase
MGAGGGLAYFRPARGLRRQSGDLRVLTVNRFNSMGNPWTADDLQTTGELSARSNLPGEWKSSTA